MKMTSLCTHKGTSKLQCQSYIRVQSNMANIVGFVWHGMDVCLSTLLLFSHKSACLAATGLAVWPANFNSIIHVIIIIILQCLMYMTYMLCPQTIFPSENMLIALTTREKYISFNKLTDN